MNILITSGWDDYQLLDTGNGLRLERFGKYILVRPDPQILWKPHLNNAFWEKADAIFTKDNHGNERWVLKNKIPHEWPIQYKNLSLWLRLTPFKHTGIFPEQSLQWDWIREKIKKEQRQVNILNLFAYTGTATLAAASAGAKVTHVDASKPAIAWARENQIKSGLQDKPIRWILDDAIKFAQKEARRGVFYDGIIMDPPVYGHGPGGEKWDFIEDFPKLIEACKQLLSKKPIFIIINAYAISASPLMLKNVLEDLNLGGQIEVGELTLQEDETKRLLSTGIFGTWTYEKNR